MMIVFLVFISFICIYFSLDLDAWINEPPSESESEDEKPKAIFAKEEPKHSRSKHTEVDEKELARVCRARTLKHIHNSFKTICSYHWHIQHFKHPPTCLILFTHNALLIFWNLYQIEKGSQEAGTGQQPVLH